jgi:CRP-like cAMP-binding protein
MAKKSVLDTGVLGKVYRDGQVIVRQGELGDCMYVIQEGQVEVVANEGDDEVCLAVLGEREFFGEMAIFEREVRTATVRALGPVRVLTVDKKTFLRRIHKDPSLAYHIVQTMSQRIRELDAEVTRLRGRK